MPIVTYEDAKAHLNITDDRDAAELTKFVNAASDLVEQRVGAVSPTSYTDSFDATGWLYVPLRHTPVVSVQTVVEYVLNVSQSLTGQPAGTATDSYGYRLESLNGGWLTRRSYGSQVPFRGPVTVTYTAGRTSVPTAVQLATLMIVANLWQTQRGAGSLPSLGGDDSAPVAQGGGIPPMAAELLRGYDTRIPTIA